MSNFEDNARQAIDALSRVCYERGVRHARAELGENGELRTIDIEMAVVANPATEGRAAPKQEQKAVVWSDMADAMGGRVPQLRRPKGDSNG